MDGRPPLLELANVSCAYGSIVALHGVSLQVRRGQIVALLGANGAGKTTTLRAVSGLLKPTGGDIVFDGRSIVGKAAEDIVGLGIAHVPEGRQIFPGLTVVENLQMGAFRQPGSTASLSRERVLTLFPRLAERLGQLGGTLSGGEQQMLAIGRALMAQPQLLLLDEPSLGLAPLVIQDILRTVKELNNEGVTVLMVEQNVNLALDIADYGYVLETGRVSVEGASQELRRNELVQRSYLGAEVMTTR